MQATQFFTYIVTNPEKEVLYIGVTNNLCQRLKEHWLNRGKNETFAGKYFCFNLVYYEQFDYIDKAIQREKQLKGWRREKKNVLIGRTNPKWLFLNAQICKEWPPANLKTRFS